MEKLIYKIRSSKKAYDKGYFAMIIGVVGIALFFWMILDFNPFLEVGISFGILLVCIYFYVRFFFRPWMWDSEE